MGFPMCYLTYFSGLAGMCKLKKTALKKKEKNRAQYIIHKLLSQIFSARRSSSKNMEF